MSQQYTFDTGLGLTLPTVASLPGTAIEGDIKYSNGTVNVNTGILYQQVVLSPLTNTVAVVANNNGLLPVVVASPSSATTQWTNRTNSLTASTIFNVVSAGFYTVHSYALFSSVTSNGNMTTSVSFTDPFSIARTQQISTGAMSTLTTGNKVAQGTAQIYCNPGDVSFFTTFFSPLTGTYNVYVRMTALS
jgi:hypothetical protein